MSNFTEHRLDLTIVDFELIDDITLVWADFPPEELLGYFEGKAIQNADKSRGMVAGAIFCYITALGKTGNETRAWVMRRKNLLQHLIPVMCSMAENQLKLLADKLHNIFKERLGAEITWMIIL